MSVWYAVLALVNMLAGGFLATSTYGFDPSTTTDLGFAVSIAVLVFGAVMGYVGYRSRRRAERIGLGLLGYATAGLATWTIIATQVFAPSTAQWMVFGSGLGHIAPSLSPGSSRCGDDPGVAPPQAQVDRQNRAGGQWPPARFSLTRRR